MADPSATWTPSYERTLAERFAKGDEEAFRMIYEHHAPAVFRNVLLPLVRRPEVAEELLAETFLRVYEHRRRFVWQARGMFPWIARIARNLGIDHLRRARRRLGLPPDFERYLPDPDAPTAEGLLVADQWRDLVRARTEEVLSRLHPRYRRVIELRLVEGRSRPEAARILGVSVPTLDVVLSRACKSFRQCYRKLYLEGDASPWEEGEP